MFREFIQNFIPPFTRRELWLIAVHLIIIRILRIDRFLYCYQNYIISRVQYNLQVEQQYKKYKKKKKIRLVSNVTFFIHDPIRLIKPFLHSIFIQHFPNKCKLTFDNRIYGHNSTKEEGKKRKRWKKICYFVHVGTFPFLDAFCSRWLLCRDGVCSIF